MCALFNSVFNSCLFLQFCEQHPRHLSVKTEASIALELETKGRETPKEDLTHLLVTFLHSKPI